MTKKEWLISITVGIVLGMLGGLLGVPRLLQAKPVGAVSTADVALLATLTSHEKWNTLQGAADIVWYLQNGGTQEYINTFAIQQPNKVYTKAKSVDGAGADSEWISDGNKAYDIDPRTKTYTDTSLPTFSKDLSMLPTTLEAAETGNVIYRHSFGMLISAPVGEYLYPQWFSQGGGTYSLAGEDILLGRKVWVIDHKKNAHDVTAWIDKETGVILKYSQKVDGKLFVDVTFTSFQVNPLLDGALFSLPSDVKHGR